MPPHREIFWAGVDVGDARKGFDAAVISASGIVAGPRRGLVTPGEVVRWLSERAPAVVAVDSPRAPAPEGCRSREGERQLVKGGVCGIRWTPDAATLRVGDYYDWVRRGLALYEALAAAPQDWDVIEVFPTASWTRWHGARAKQSRAQWSRQALAALALEGLPSRTSQDARDAIAAAVTAREYTYGRVDTFGDIVVPKVAKAT